MLGTNDLRNRWKKPEEEPTAAQMIAGLKQMAVRAHSRGVKIIGATLTAFGNETYMANAWNPQREQVRLAATFELALVAPVSSSVPQCLRKVGFETPSTRAMSASGMP